MSDKHHIFDPSVCDLNLRVSLTGFYVVSRAMLVQHFVNPGQLKGFKQYHAHKNTQKHVILTFDGAYDLDIQ